ncbi:DUF5680 domain-containing protein [Candidatus Saccharibacteria bacterium]|nr:DUF5680 domain-containing protein [Candidatus Saccharibacteria bacterium]
MGRTARLGADTDAIDLINFLMWQRTHRSFACGKQFITDHNNGLCSTAVCYWQQFKQHDEWSNGNPSRGTERIFIRGAGQDGHTWDGSKFWTLCFEMQYSDEKLPDAPDGIIGRCLKPALLKPPSDFPVRGPERFLSPDGTLLYTNTHTGDIHKFTGSEMIVDAGTHHLFWSSTYNGGIVGELV